MTPAYEHNGRPCTREAFYAIACDPRRSVAVEACAGAGKTWMLVSRILRALLDGAAPQEILAITFTKKAAGEMRQRLQQWLAEYAVASPEDRIKALVERGIDPASASSQADQLQNLYQTVLAAGRPVQIRTFHSWFAALLRTAPLQVLGELGLPASYELLEDDQDAVAEVWRRYLRSLAQHEDLRADYAALVAAHGRHRTHQALEAALAKRVEFTLADAAGAVDGAVPPFDAVYPRLAGVDHPSDWLLQRAAGRDMLANAARALGGMAKTFAAKGLELQAALEGGDWSGVLCALFTGKGGSGTPRAFSTSANQAAAMETVRAAQNEADMLRAACAQVEARLYHQRLTRLTRRLIQEFALLKRERGWVDMGDIERAALVLLGDEVLSGWVQERLDARVRHLLIDEFQDTNPLQWQALHAWLSGYAGAGGGQGAPSVFIVGDPKQSIYRFRRADPQVFKAAKAFVCEALGGELLACDHTRRNTPTVLDAVNTVMGAAQEAGEYDDFRKHTTESDGAGQLLALPAIPRPERAARPDADDAPPWRDSLTVAREVPEKTLRTLECRQAARWIAGEVAQGVALKAIMVLARKREPLSVLQMELRRLGIACEQPEQQLLGEQPVVQDVLALVDALVSPGHDLSLARALKSPLFGLGDDDLTRIALAVQAAGTPRASWLNVLQNTELEAVDAQALHADLMQYRDWLLGLPPHDALQAIYTHGDVLARFAAAAPEPERAHQLAQLRALLAAALQLGGGRYLTAYQLVRAMRRQRIAAPRQAQPQAVQLLTVHGAKGLEADTVLLLDSQAAAPGGRGAPLALIDWPGAAAAPTQFVFSASESAPPPSATALAEREAESGAREELNALYVAMTRARQRIVLSSVTPHGTPTAASWWQRIEPLTEPLQAPSMDAAPADASLAEFVLPELPMVQVPQRHDALNSEASSDKPDASPTDASRLGEAMHWLLEHAGDTPDGWLALRRTQAMRRFAVTDAQADRAEALARQILAGEGGWAWRHEHIVEHFNEIELVHAGQRLRIDRLVRRRAGAHGDEAWWVLDYKSAATPERDPALVAQLARYREAVQQAYAGAAVHAAFLSADGRVVVV